MLGTGNALVTRCYNTCFVMDNGRDKLLVDAGGGNGVLSQLERAGIDGGEIHHIYVTHAHTDHILGVIWMVRVFIQRYLAGKYNGELHVWSHAKVIHILRFNLGNMLTSKQFAEIGHCVFFHEVSEKDEIDCGSFHLRVFDILSTKEKQFGFATTVEGRRIVCLGDEPYNEANEALVAGADWLLPTARSSIPTRSTTPRCATPHCWPSAWEWPTCCSTTPRTRPLPPASRTTPLRPAPTSRATCSYPTIWKP